MLEPVVATAVVALCSLTGVLLFRNSGHIVGTHRVILPFAVGVFLAIIFLELVPETLEGSHDYGPFAILAGFFGFYLIAHLLTTYHHHQHGRSDTRVGSGAKMLLVGDAIHNIADGVVITTAFLLDPALGVVATIGVILHEIPQEIAEFGVLIASGYTRSRALFLNFLSASSILLGTFAALFFVSYAEGFLWVLTGVAAGNLLYIATSDLIPELRHSHRDHFYHIFTAALMGVLLIAGALFLSHEYMESRGAGHSHEDGAELHSGEHEH